MIVFWTCALALTIFLYVTLDGFDLGVGMLLPLARDEQARRNMLAAIAPVWDGNETWLVLNATILFGIFPLTYATLLSALYLPLLAMLLALIFRGVAFEFRDKSERMRGFWDLSFIAGSFIASFIQGAAIGALVQGLPMKGVHYIGGPFGWLSPFALLCGVGLCLGYALMGAGWLTYKSSPDVRALAFRKLPILLAGVILFLAAALAAALSLDLPVMALWTSRPVLFVFPALGLAAAAILSWSIVRRKSLLPFLGAMGLFAAAFGTLAFSFYPYMIPFAITTLQAAAPVESQSFLFWGAGLFVMPLTLIYTLVIYFVFKGRVDPSAQSYGENPS
jgi:cytochrome bd ubiquinol oxidase subunit II